MSKVCREFGGMAGIDPTAVTSPPAWYMTILVMWTCTVLTLLLLLLKGDDDALEK